MFIYEARATRQLPVASRPLEINRNILKYIHTALHQISASLHNGAEKSFKN